MFKIAILIDCELYISNVKAGRNYKNIKNYNLINSFISKHVFLTINIRLIRCFMGDHTRGHFTSCVVSELRRSEDKEGHRMLRMRATSIMSARYYLAKHGIRGLLFRLNYCHQASIFFSLSTECSNFLILHTASVKFIYATKQKANELRLISLDKMNHD